MAQRPEPQKPSKNYSHRILSVLELPGIETAMTEAVAHMGINSSISVGDEAGSFTVCLDGWSYPDLIHEFGGCTAVGHFSGIPRKWHMGLQQYTGG